MRYTIEVKGFRDEVTLMNKKTYIAFRKNIKLGKNLFKKSIWLVKKYENYKKVKPIDNHLILFESYQATRMSGNPLAIFEEMITNPEYKDFRFVWVLNDDDNPYKKIYEKDKRVSFCRAHSLKFVKYLSTAKYLVNNKTFPYYFAKRDGQIYINTWHGIPLKTLGKQQKGAMGQYKNVCRNYLHADYLVMPDRFTADILIDSCDIRTLYQGTIVDAGYPRVDNTLNTDYQEMRKFLADCVDIDLSKKLVLYAPTWRGEVGNTLDTSEQIIKHLVDITKGLSDEYALVLKIHDRTYENIQNNDKLCKIKNVPDWIDTNKLLAAIDVLITDYSSIYFDYLCLKRPIIFFVYDREEYERTRGLYFSLDTFVPGPLCYTPDEVNQALRNNIKLQSEYEQIANQIQLKHCYNDDGNSTKRVLDIIMNRKKERYIYKLTPDARPRVLINTPAFADSQNAFTFVNMINSIENEGYNVILLYCTVVTSRDEYYLKKLNPEINVIYRVPVPHRKVIDAMLSKPYSKKKKNSVYISEDAARKYRLHYFPHIEFDIAIDLGGKFNLWQFIMARTEFKKKVVFLDANKNSYDVDQLIYLKQNFDCIACPSVEMYERYQNLLERTSGKAELKLLALPVLFEKYSKNLKQDLASYFSSVGDLVKNHGDSSEQNFHNADIEADHEYQSWSQEALMPLTEAFSDAGWYNEQNQYFINKFIKLITE